MSTYVSKYIKLSTQPWTGNGITNPTESLTLEGIDSSITLSQEDSVFLIDGFPASSSSGGVSSLTVTPPITSSGSSGEIILDLSSSSEGISRVYQGDGILIDAPTGDIQMVTPGGVTSVSEAPLNNTLNIQWDGTSAMTIDTYTNIVAAIDTVNIPIDGLPFTSPLITPPLTQGIYIVDIYNNDAVARGNIAHVSGMGRSDSSGMFTVTGTMASAYSSVDNQDRVIIDNYFDETSQLTSIYFIVGSTFGWQFGDVLQIGFYRIL